jgi:hypothetical protein
MSALRSFTLTVVAAIAICSPAFADDDPPARVARLNYISGQVSIQPNGVNDWVTASINRPLTSSDRVWADKDARAELQLGGAAIRLDSNTSLTFVNVSDNNVQIQLDEGILNLHVTELFDGEIYSIDTPNLQFTVRKSGTYRFDVNNAGDTTAVTVFKGEGDVTGDGPAVRIKKDQRFTFTGGKSLQYAANNNPGRDGFDDWCFVRADREDRSQSARYVSRSVVGYSDLDDYGEWVAAPTYGRIWVPRGVSVGWAPYRYGHWVWVAPWGWTWVDDAPWGFAPFHYGRWVRYNNYWGWCPGPYRSRAIYAPALVAWVGGSHWGVGLSFGVGGGVGWFPLGYGDPYIPYYHHSRGYFHNVNVRNTHITNITHITNNYYNNHGDVRNIHYRNRGIDGAVTAVSNDDFRSSRSIHDRYVPVRGRDVERAEIEREVRVRPTTNSVLGPNAGQKRTEPPMWRTSRNDRPNPAGQRDGSSAADLNSPRGDRPSPGMRPARERVEAVPSTGTQGVANGRTDRVPRPSDRNNNVTVAEVERNDNVPRPPRSNRSGDDNERMRPGRLSPNPSDPASAGNTTRPERSQPSPSAGRDNGQSSVPHPPASIENRPERSNDAVGNNDRSYTPRSGEPRMREPRSVPRPTEGQVIRQEPRNDTPREQHTYSAPTRQDRIASPSSERPTYSAPPRVERSTPRSEAPRSEPRSSSGGGGREVHQSAPPQRQAEPSRSAPPSHQSAPSNGGRSGSTHADRKSGNDRAN